MFSFASLTLALTAVSSVSGLVIPRATPPAGWATAILEPYDTYHTRYLAVGCKGKQGSAFFDKCCHPLLATQKLSSRPKECIPSTPASPSTSAVQPTSTPPVDDDDEYDDCEDDDDHPAPTVTTSTKGPAATPTESPVVTSTKVLPTPSPTKTSTPKPTQTPVNNGSGGDVNAGGFATFFYQNGVAGACGKVHSDNDMIAAIDGHRYGNLGVKSSLCGKQVLITNPANKKSVTVTIADACPTCRNGNSIDLSEAAFKKIATLDQGMVGINWTFL
jgi:hypothetical protein